VHEERPSEAAALSNCTLHVTWGTLRDRDVRRSKESMMFHSERLMVLVLANDWPVRTDKSMPEIYSTPDWSVHEIGAVQSPPLV
jgi:hypothetical protein